MVPSLSTPSNWESLLPNELSHDSAWIAFFQQQIMNCGKQKKWSPEFIQISIDLWTRSPRAYVNLQRVLRLPSGKHLQRYKNFIDQSPGIIWENLHWMVLEADRQKVSKEGRAGFIIIDEVQIQRDLQMDSAMPDCKLFGTTNYGRVQGAHMLRKHGGGHLPATHILQFVFLGNTGFKWPVCYFATTEAHSSELAVLVWRVISTVQTCRFKVNGILMDGGSNNRKFVKLCLIPDPNSPYLISNSRDASHIVAVMLDPSHGIKKLRNSFLASHDESRNRRLRRRANFCKWSHWEDAYKWDLQHTLRV